jgi:FkbM family methyltransferase
MKQIARGFFTLDQRRQIALFRKRIHASLTISPYVRALKLLPRSQFIRIKENLRLTDRLDYKRGNILMNIDTSIQLMRLRSCAKEPETVEWLETNFRPGDVLYDVGANVGSYSFVGYIVAAGDCTVYAFEPSFSTFAALCQNVFLNDCDEKIVPLQVALSDETKLLTFNYSNISAGSSMHSIGAAINQAAQHFHPSYKQPMLSYRLDDLVAQFTLRPPNHIKIDTDGAELKILRGAEKTLEYPELRTIFIEVNEMLPTCPEMLSYIKGKGFVVRSRVAAGVSEGFFNYLFERPGGLEQRDE